MPQTIKYISNIQEVCDSNTTRIISPRVLPAFDIDFTGPTYETLTIAANLTLTGSNYASVSTKYIKITADGGGPYTLSFPAGWVFLLAAPAVLAASKIALLKLTSWGTTEADVTAEYSVQP